MRDHHLRCCLPCIRCIRGRHLREGLGARNRGRDPHKVVDVTELDKERVAFHGEVHPAKEVADQQNSAIIIGWKSAVFLSNVILHGETIHECTRSHVSMLVTKRETWRPDGTLEWRSPPWFETSPETELHRNGSVTFQGSSVFKILTEDSGNLP